MFVADSDIFDPHGDGFEDGYSRGSLEARVGTGCGLGGVCGCERCEKLEPELVEEVECFLSRLTGFWGVTIALIWCVCT